VLGELAPALRPTLFRATTIAEARAVLADGLRSRGP
jgi:hypothetical protein